MMAHSTTCSMLHGTQSWSNWFCHGCTVGAKSYFGSELACTPLTAHVGLSCSGWETVSVSLLHQTVGWIIFVYEMCSWVDDAVEYLWSTDGQRDADHLLHFTKAYQSLSDLLVWYSDFLPKIKVIWGSDLMRPPSQFELLVVIVFSCLLAGVSLLLFGHVYQTLNDLVMLGSCYCSVCFAHTCINQF